MSEDNAQEIEKSQDPYQALSDLKNELEQSNDPLDKAKLMTLEKLKTAYEEAENNPETAKMAYRSYMQAKDEEFEIGRKHISDEEQRRLKPVIDRIEERLGIESGGQTSFDPNLPEQ